MPRWDAGELIDAPRFSWRNILAMIGPGLVMGASAIGGGEWLAGPAVTAKYGGALLWVATVSIIFQVIYNIAMSAGLAPVKGITLPLMSYGGSSLIASLAAFGLILNVRMRRFTN